MSASSARSTTTAALAVPVILLFCWGVPRLLVSSLGIDGHWTSYLYQYLMGGLVFGIGLWVILASGACNFRRPGDRQWLMVLVFGYLWYAAIHGVVTFLAWAVPFRGA